MAQKKTRILGECELLNANAKMWTASLIIIIIIVNAVMIIIDLSGVDQKLLHFCLLQPEKNLLKIQQKALEIKWKKKNRKKYIYNWRNSRSVETNTIINSSWRKEDVATADRIVVWWCCCYFCRCMQCNNFTSNTQTAKWQCEQSSNNR